MTSLNGKVAAVVGGSRGIGAAIVRKLAARGAKVAFTYKSQREKADAIVDEIGKAGGEALAFQADIVDEAALAQALDGAAKAFGRIDILVNNAGILGARAIEDTDFEFYAALFNTHVWGTIAATKLALKHFPQGDGRIVNISSLRAYQPSAKTAIYSASKAAVSTLTQSLAIELGPRGITVNAIAPGITKTDMTAGMPEERRKTIIGSTPLGRLGEPDDIASAVVLLSLDEARWITGRTILADGGLIGT